MSSHETSLLEDAIRQARWERVRRGVTVALGRTAVLALCLVVWTVVSGRWLDRSLISDPGEVLAAAVDSLASGRLWPHLAQTLLEVALGYLIGATAGLGLALGVGLSDTAQRVLRPFLTALYAIPKVAMAPLIIMWFGLGTSPKVFLAGGFVFFVMFMSGIAGVENVNPNHVSVARVMGASRIAVLSKIVFPSIVPFLMTGLRLAIPEAFTGAVIGEFLAANRGVGYLINSATTQLNMAASFAAILVLLLLVMIFDVAVSMLERNALSWRPIPVTSGT